MPKRVKVADRFLTVHSYCASTVTIIRHYIGRYKLKGKLIFVPLESRFKRLPGSIRKGVNKSFDSISAAVSYFRTLHKLSDFRLSRIPTPIKVGLGFRVKPVSEFDTAERRQQLLKLRSRSNKKCYRSAVSKSCELPKDRRVHFRALWKSHTDREVKRKLEMAEKSRREPTQIPPVIFSTVEDLQKLYYAQQYVNKSKSTSRTEAEVANLLGQPELKRRVTAMLKPYQLAHDKSGFTYYTDISSPKRDRKIVATSKLQKGSAVCNPAADYMWLGNKTHAKLKNSKEKS
jgi:hypothetical protein